MRSASLRLTSTALLILTVGLGPVACSDDTDPAGGAGNVDPGDQGGDAGGDAGGGVGIGDGGGDLGGGAGGDVGGGAAGGAAGGATGADAGGDDSPECRVDLECPSPMRCLDNKCVGPDFCYEDGDCGAGQRCVDNSCTTMIAL